MTLMKLYRALQQLLEDGPHDIRNHVVLMNTDGGPYALGAVKADAAMGVVWLDRDGGEGAWRRCALPRRSARREAGDD